MQEQNPDRFDPFNSRLARDIRNSLSRSFLQSLSEKDPGPYRSLVEGYLAQDLEQPFRMYVKTRLAKYEGLYAVIAREGIEDKMARAGLFWDQALYFEMHELLEELWLGAGGDRRRALQGLIRAAGMMIHVENGNYRAAASMGAKALTALKLYNSYLQDFSGLESVAAEVDRTLAEMDGRAK